jgi:hypothetical protein
LSGPNRQINVAEVEGGRKFQATKPMGLMAALFCAVDWLCRVRFFEGVSPYIFRRHAANRFIAIHLDGIMNDAAKRMVVSNGSNSRAFDMIPGIVRTISHANNDAVTDFEALTHSSSSSATASESS